MNVAEEPDEPELTCPVCRARQTYRPECRRCTADLALYVLTLRSLEHARRQGDKARRLGRRELAQRMASYARWLSP